MTRSSAPRRLTVLLTVYNGGVHLAEAVDSILRQTYVDFELLVVDDGSTDGSSDYLAGLSDPRVRVVRQENQGLVAALNRGLAETTTELVARMDADDVSAPSRLARQVEHLDANPRVAVVGCCYQVVDEGGRPEEVVHVAADPEYLRRQLYFRNTLAHGSVMFRTSAARAAGGYREVGPVEDYDLWTRIASGHDVAALPDRLFTYRRTGSGISSRAGQVQHDALARTRSALHRDHPMTVPSPREVLAQGRSHLRRYGSTCSRPLDGYVFDHAWLAIVLVRERRLLPAARLAAGVVLLLLRHPGAVRGLPVVHELLANRRHAGRPA